MVKAFAKKILFVTVIASLIGLPLFAQAQDKPLKKIRWGVTSISASNWIPWIAKDAKIYEKNGLDVELILLRGSGQTSVAILGGSIFAAPVTLPHRDARGSRRGGSDQHGSHCARSSEQAAGQAGNQTTRRLKGEKNCDLEPGFSRRFSHSSYIIRKHGLDPTRDVIGSSIGTPPETASGAGSRAMLMRRTCPIPRTLKRSAWAIEFYGIRGKKSSILPCRSSRGVRPSRRSRHGDARWSNRMLKASPI